MASSEPARPAPIMVTLFSGMLSGETPYRLLQLIKRKMHGVGMQAKRVSSQIAGFVQHRQHHQPLSECFVQNTFGVTVGPEKFALKFSLPLQHQDPDREKVIF